MLLSEVMLSNVKESVAVESTLASTSVLSEIEFAFSISLFNCEGL